MASMTKAQTLQYLRNISGELATATLKRLDDTLPWYREMPPSRRSSPRSAGPGSHRTTGVERARGHRGRDAPGTSSPNPSADPVGGRG